MPPPPLPPRAHVVLALVAILDAGCATSLTLSAAPSVDTKGRFGSEGRVEGAAAFGAPELRGYATLAAGGGYLGGLRAGYGLVAPEAGLEGGSGVRWSAGAFYAPRFYGRPVQVLQSGGVAAQVLFRVGRTIGDGGGLAIGPRLSVEGASLPALDAAPLAPDLHVALFHLGLAVRWITFDTTGKRLP